MPGCCALAVSVAPLELPFLISNVLKAGTAPKLVRPFRPPPPFAPPQRSTAILAVIVTGHRLEACAPFAPLTGLDSPRGIQSTTARRTIRLNTDIHMS